MSRFFFSGLVFVLSLVACAQPALPQLQTGPDIPVGVASVQTPAQTLAQPSTHTSTQPSIDVYIHNGWDTLSRSMTACKSLIDPKVTTPPVLYLPAQMPLPAEVAAMQQQCRVDLRHLPRKINHMGDVAISEITQPGLLYLPHRYVVPGGRFNEMYGWDSYFIVLGLVRDGRAEMARGMIENFFFEIENYGALLNANRTYFLTRSQPPLLTSMIRAVYDDQRSWNGKAAARAWLGHAYEYAQRDHELWMQPAHRAGQTGLAHYEDIGEGPVPEMADDSEYYPDVIRWLEAHPDMKNNYLVAGGENPTAAEAAELAETSCDPRVSKLCARAYVAGYRLSRDYYRGDRAMRESGFDTSFRFGPFSGSTQNYAPVCLNSLLYKYERDLAYFATLLGRKAEADRWDQAATHRRQAINKYLWHADTGMFYDYNYVGQQPSTYNYVSAFYPLWAGLATKQQAAAVEKHLSIFEHEGGLAMSDVQSGTQWDQPFGWAPGNWFPTAGLLHYGYKVDADRVSRKFTDTVRRNYQSDGTIREKYNMTTGSSNVQVAAGYKSNVVGFGWTNAVYLEMMAIQKRNNPARRR